MDGKGKFTSLEKWLYRTGGQEAGAETEQDGRQGSNGKGEGLDDGGGGGRKDESKEGITGGGGEPACPGEEETLSH